MKQELNIGEIVKVKQFCFTNKAGGTGMSRCHFEQFRAGHTDEEFQGEAEVQITDRWDDYECGERGVGVAVTTDLVKYLDRNANAYDRRVFISEFDLA